MNKIDLCKTIQMNVSKLTENENLELFKIILDTKANYTKNNNGIFLNLNWIEEELLVKINNYILFCIKSQNEISKYELMKTLLNDTINTKDINDDDYASSGNAFNDALGAGVPPSVAAVAAVAAVATVPPVVPPAGVSVPATVPTDTTASITVDTDGSGLIPAANSINPKQKFSSSMKFYLLKKKFMKQNTCYNACLENDLSYEDYLIT
jgi:hypothetical protein